MDDDNFAIVLEINVIIVSVQGTKMFTNMVPTLDDLVLATK